MSDYETFLARKREVAPAVGLDKVPPLNPDLHPWQARIVDWCLQMGRAALFADTGLGKSLMQLEWAQHVSEQAGPVLILTPLAVAQQTVREASKWGVRGNVRHTRGDDGGGGVQVANYEMLHAYDPSRFAGVVLDESSILKAFTGKIRTQIIEAFRETPYRLACTATPAPNDHMELGNHSEFLGVRSRTEMLAEFFVHDGGSTQSWRLKGHAQDAFWGWVASWAIMLRMPSDLGYSDEGYILPELIEETINVPVDESDAQDAGLLFAEEAVTLTDQRAVRKSTTARRVAAIRDQIMAEPDEPAIVWCEYNAEAEMMAAALEGAINVQGRDNAAAKESALLGFADGDFRWLATKPSIAGFGMNWQHCAREYFMGPSHSYEQTYQAIRRCWRFGQTRPVIVRTCVAGTETAVLRNLQRKARDAAEMADKMRGAIQSIQREHERWVKYEPRQEMGIPPWLSSTSSTAKAGRCTEATA